ncbi:uncharacterized protein DUF5034 [Bacteroides heparinolyticus]|uniref:Uncharacterized protein DUF5034 n=1 Tax=Prevotella heparinolytica TaxID=28113 RepID=A0A4R2M334_9BACE|nr:DUF5034 domain-containing protein [Bacteroides heparinolyticus]TCO88955.1 uncharacterized protein DUF5034 [Bacteroides heparinolyticus]
MKADYLSRIFFCIVMLLFTAMTCEDEHTPPVGDVCGLKLESMDNSGEHPVGISDGRCPKEAYWLNVLPELKAEEEEAKEWREYLLKHPIADMRIITLTDFNADYPAGSDIFHLFYRYHSPGSLKFPINYLANAPLSMVLLTYPASGVYQFRVEFVLGSGGGNGEDDMEEAHRSFSAETELLEFY